MVQQLAMQIKLMKGMKGMKGEYYYKLVFKNEYSKNNLHNLKLIKLKFKCLSKL